jgi:hypothetical protein
MIVVDREIYTYYQNNKFKNLKLLYKDTMMNDYKFMVKKNNETFYDLFNYIINTNSYYNYRNQGISNLKASILEDSTLEQVYMIVLAIIFIILYIIDNIIGYIAGFKLKKHITEVKKDSTEDYKVDKYEWVYKRLKTAFPGFHPIRKVKTVLNRNKKDND